MYTKFRALVLHNYFEIYFFIGYIALKGETIMAKTARKNRVRNAQRKNRELRKAMKGKGSRVTTRNVVVLSMILRGQGSGSHGDARKEENRTACRGKWEE